jgi:lipoprotein-anchoring transpeptidase ErfK/SrfK
VRLPSPPEASFSGRWIDADLSFPVLVTAYEEDRAVNAMLAVTGVAAWMTPTGTFKIMRRVESETITSADLGIPLDSPGGYLLENVLFTQYFSGGGAALHYNYWSDAFGYPDTRGCLGLTYDDALWLWNWAAVETPVVIHQ